MACKYKYNNNWYSKEELKSILLKERGIDSKGELITPSVTNNPKQAKITKENTTSIESVKSKYNLLDTEYGTLDLNEEELISAEDYLESLKTATITFNDNSVNNEYVDANKWFINIESNYPDGNFGTKKEAEDYLKNKIQEAQNSLNKLKSKPKKEYTSQALTNLKIAALKEVARKYPRSLIRSEVKPINTSQYNSLFDESEDDLPFQLIGEKELSYKQKLEEQLKKQQAQQLYSQYLESLNKPNTNPILQNNQQEQVKKFAELQERLNNKEFLEGAKFAYENSEDLKSFGTQEQYNDYIARVSLGIIKNPSSGDYNYTSQVKDIVYHGSKYGSLDIKTIKDYKPSVETNRVGIFFSKRIDLAEVYSKEIEKIKTKEEQELENEIIKSLDPEEREWYFRSSGNIKKEKLPVFSTIINVSNPKQISLIEWDKIIRNQKYGKPTDGENLKKSLKSENYDSIEIPSFLDGFEKFKNKEEFLAFRDKKGFYNLPKTIQDKYFEEYSEVDKNIADYYASQYAVFEPEQIHILGSKQDIEGFKDFVQSKQSITPRKGISELFSENPQLASIGTQEQYSQYLDTIFPDSKMKDIVYHNTDEQFESFKVPFYAEDMYGEDAPIGVFFSTDKQYTSNFGKRNISAILNLKNPKFEKEIEYEKVAGFRLGKKITEFDGFYGNDKIDLRDANPSKGVEYVVFEPEQIHILGGKQDIEGFKGFVSENNILFSQDAPISNPTVELRKKEKQTQKENELKNNVVGFYDGEKIVINKDHKNFGTGILVHEHVHPLLNDLNSIISGFFDGAVTTEKEINKAKDTKENLYTEATKLLGDYEITQIRSLTVYKNLSEEQFKNEVIARAVELTSNKITKDNKSFIDAMKDFISFMIKHIRSRFFRAVIQNKSVSAKDLEPIVGINQLASVYLMSGAAKLTMDRKGNLRQGTAKSTEFDKIMERLNDFGNIKNIVDNNSFENFTKFYDYKKYNSVIKHEKPTLVEKADNNTVYENITVDGANKVAELLASGITPDTMNIAAAMLHDGWNPQHITVVLNNPLLKEYFARMKAKYLIDGFSLENQQLVLDEMKSKYLPDELIDLNLINDNFYTEKYIGDQRVITPKYIIDIDKMYDRKRGIHNSDTISVEKQNKEIIKHQFEAMLNTLMYQETTKELVTVSNIFNLNSNGGTKSFIHDQSIYETADEILTTNKVGKYDLGSVVDDSYMGTVLSNFIEMRDLMSSQKGLSVITDYKEVIDNFVKHYKEFYSIGEFTDYKKKQIINAFTAALPEYIKNKVFSTLPNKDNVEYIKYKLLSVYDSDNKRNPDNLGDIVDRIQADMKKYPDHVLNIEKTLFNSFETKLENKYKLVQFNTGRIAPNIKDNIKTNLLDLYNNPKELFKDRSDYTTKTLIDDLFDYSIVTGANSGPFKFFDYMPSELLLKNFARAERDQIIDFQNSFKTADDHLDFFISILVNNPDMLPNIDSLPKNYKGRIFKKSFYNKEKKAYDYQIYTVKKVKNSQTGIQEAIPGKALPQITDKTKIKQYTIRFDLNQYSETTIKSGYNIISGGNKKSLSIPIPNIYENDNKQAIELFQKDDSENKIVAKYAFGDTIVNPELRAIYKDIVQDVNVESVGIEFVDIIDNNEANYGRYNRKAHTIQISTKAMMTGKYSLADILVHEYTHVQMANMVDIYENIKLGRIKKESIGDKAYDQMKFLDSVFETYKQLHPNDVASQNLDEFISEVRRSQNVRNNIKAFPKKLLTRVINAITDLIKNILGLSNTQEINGQQIHDTTLDFISRLSKNKILIYSDGTNTYQFTSTVDGIVLGGTLNGEILIDPENTLTEVLSNNIYKRYKLVSDQAEGIYDQNISRVKPISYNLTATEFNKKMKDIKVIMNDPLLTHEDLINIINKRFNELVYFSELYKGILRKSSDRKELSNAKKALKLVENDIDKIMVHLDKAVNAKNVKDRMDYVDSVIDSINDVVNSETANPIEIMTANDFLTRLTDIFDPKKTNLNVYTDDDVADLEFITEEAKQDPEIAYKYNEQVSRIVALNKKLMDKTLLTVENEVKKRDEFAKTDFNYNNENNNRDLSWFEKWVMTPDRTGDDFLNWWMVLNNDVEAAYKNDISVKFDEIQKVQNRLIPTLERYYSNLPLGKELDNYHKFGIYSVMLDEYGNLKMPYSSSYFDTINKFKSKIKDAENIWKNAAPSERSSKYAKLKEARDKYAKFVSDSNYSKRSEIEDAINKETNPSKLKQLQRVLDKYDIYKSAHLEKFEADYDVFSEDLKEEILTVTDENGIKTDIKKSVKRQQLEFIEENYPYQDIDDLKSYVKSKLNLNYNYSTDVSNIVRRSTSTDAIISSIPRKYTYMYQVPKQQFWNDMSFMDIPEIAEFYNLYVETMKEIRDNLPTRFSKELNLSDIPFILRNVLNYSLKDLITKPDIRNSLYKNYVAGFTLKDKYLNQDNFGENYNDNIINTRFGQLNAFSKNKAVKERLILRLKEAGLPILDESGKVNPRRANRKNGTYSKEFLDIEQDVKNQIDTELLEMKSFDLGKVVEVYYIEAMAYKHKMKEINTFNLIKDAALKTWKSHTGESGEAQPFNDKINMLLDTDKILKGIPARKVLKEKYLSMLGKKYSVLEEKRKKELEETVRVLEEELTDVKNDPIQTENALMYIENIEEEIRKRKDEIDNLGAEINVGNIIRKTLAFDIARNLWGNPRSSIGNVIMGMISNRLEAADGRIFGMDSYKKMFDKIYMKSEITPFLAGTFGGLLLGVTGGLIGAGFGFAVGYGINRMMHKRTKDPETTTVFNMMGMYDILQQQAQEQQLETINDRSSNTYKNKLLRSDAGELIRDPMMFITKSEIPHQAVILGSILDSTLILDPDNIDDKKTITLLSYLTKIGSEGMKFRADYDQIIYLKLNTTQGETITEVPLKILLERVATTSAAMSAKTHGNYRLNTKQLAKLDDRTVLATEFKTWAAEGFAGRYEDKKVNRTISVSLTSSPYQNADENYHTKGMVQTSFEKIGTPLTLGLTILQPSFNNVLWGTIGAFGSSTFLGASAAIASPLLTALASVGGLYYLHNKGYEQTVDKGVQRAFYKALGARVFKKLMTADYYKKFSEVTLNGETIDASEYLDKVLSKEDSANIRKLIEQTGMLTFYSMMYYALLATKISSKDDDDDDIQLEQKYLNFALNTMGRTMLDIQSYTNAGDIISKYGSYDKIAPAISIVPQSWDAASSFTTYMFSGGTEGIYERREGQYEKGDPKFVKKVKKILPFTRTYDSFISSTEQEFEMFKGNNR